MASKPNTRVTHQVRCRNQANPQIYVDVEVLDCITLLLPNGKAELFALTPRVPGTTITPLILDKTGDGNGKGTLGDPNATRSSHMERMTSRTDATQYIDVEILDGFTLLPFNSVEPSDENDDERNSAGDLDSGQRNAAPEGFFCPSTKATTLIVDGTGLGLGIKPQQSDITRGGHINMVTDAGDTDDGTAAADAIPPKQHPFVATIKLDAMNFQAANGKDVLLLVPKSTITDVDRTVYGIDPHTGDTHAPPDNTDPNNYVIVPNASSGANLGSMPVSAQTGEAGPINQGLFWWIKKISNNIRQPWYWYAPRQTPLAFSYFGVPPEDANPKWGYRGFQLFNSFPVVWILSASGDVVSMGDFGAASLVDAATTGSWFTSGTIPNFASPAGGGVKPFGVLPFLDPPVSLSDFSTTTPNIWQMTGVPQPNLANPGLPWDRTSNPYLWPTESLAEEVAMAFQSDWDSCSNNVNASLSGLTPGGRTGDLWTSNPPGWRWNFNWTDPFEPGHYTAFGNGIEPGLNHSGIPLEVFVPATAWTLSVGQLPPLTWDTRPSLAYPFPLAPILWTSE